MLSYARLGTDVLLSSHTNMTVLWPKLRADERSAAKILYTCKYFHQFLSFYCQELSFV